MDKGSVVVVQARAVIPRTNGEERLQALVRAAKDGDGGRNGTAKCEYRVDERVRRVSQGPAADPVLVMDGEKKVMEVGGALGAVEGQPYA